MTETILVLTVSFTTMGLLIWLGIMSNKFFKYFRQITEEMVYEKKKDK
tara:strand:- start:802 stop:945 length:144 start_codon:yes stop_codon:yes gene_type:complete